MFGTEAALVKLVVRQLRGGKSPWGTVQVVTEWDYRNGRTDVLARCKAGTLVAFEAKLTRWQVACDQAYRNTAYASRTYVVLPPDIALRALAAEAFFRSRRIGLCSASPDGLQVIIEPPVVSPLMQWVADLAHRSFNGLKNDNAERRRRRAGSLCGA